ncbi:GAK system XXXCH domain-containing protein [Thermodesulfatator atlanticus]|uniref:GAK system XXXCH domain-containing protein n=1 Tax=Thermodesulfatator atlanticus TaxID=501497 RepID=UPI0003B68485|nr:GAK system XXXCH domain-containing protein [Thermodesulfatator atlanticus]
MLKKKDYQNMELEELGSFLEQLGLAIKEGFLNLNDEKWPLRTDTLKVKWEIKIDKEETKFKLSFSAKKEDLAKKKYSESDKSSSSLKPKQLKKQMGGLWKVIVRDVKYQQLPSLQDINALLAVMEQYSRFAEDTWQTAWRACLEKVMLLKQAVNEQDLLSVKEITEEIIRLEKSCHKRYKQKTFAKYKDLFFFSDRKWERIP